MMPEWKAAFLVARWEFTRFIKPKQQLVSMLLTFVIFGGFAMAGRLGSDDAQLRTVAVIGAETAPMAALQPASLRFTTHRASEEDSLRAAIRERSLDGLLIARSADSAQLVLRRDEPWTGELRTVLAAARQQRMMEQAGVSAEQLATILAPPVIEVSYETRGAGQDRGERIALVIIISLMLMAVFFGMGYIFVSITGEKQIRVTEQVVSAISAQAWMDGKIIGLIAVSLFTVLAQVVAFLAVKLTVSRLFDVSVLPLPASLGDPATVALIVLFAVLGLTFWFAFLGALAATIDDPNSSTRGSLLFVPMLATGMAFLVLKNPDATASRVAALFPPTAPSAMPVRFLMTDVPRMEIAVSLALLVVAIFLLRKAAGRIFRLGMLMYGKEPSWSELRRWVMQR